MKKRTNVSVARVTVNKIKPEDMDKFLWDTQALVKKLEDDFGIGAEVEYKVENDSYYEEEQK